MPPSIATECRWIGSSSSTNLSNVLLTGGASFEGEGGGFRVSSGKVEGELEEVEPNPNILGVNS